MALEAFEIATRWGVLDRDGSTILVTSVLFCNYDKEERDMVKYWEIVRILSLFIVLDYL